MSKTTRPLKTWEFQGWNTGYLVTVSADGLLYEDARGTLLPLTYEVLDEFESLWGHTPGVREMLDAQARGEPLPGDDDDE